MKILHICLASFYIDNYSYQENILPKMHKKLGHEVRILASTETYRDGKVLGYLKPNEYYNEDGILVTRIPYISYLPLSIAKKLRIYKGIIEYLCNFKPDFIFLHDVQFLSICEVINYVKKNNVKIVADGHSDFSNSARTFASYYFLHKLVYYPAIKIAERYISKFYGTLPARVDFFKSVYNIPAEKVSFLPMGIDDTIASKCIEQNAGVKIRERYGIEEDDFLIVTGGKIDLAKTQTLLLMEAVKRLGSKNIKLLIFGSIVDELREKFDALCCDNIKYLGWANVEESYCYFLAADIVAFPGRHSVYWEQAAGLGKPLIVKYWEGTTHVDCGGNVKFLYDDSVEEIYNTIKEIVEQKDIYSNMLNAANEAKATFSYLDIAKRSLA